MRNECISSQVTLSPDNRLEDWVQLSHQLFGIKEAPHFALNIQLCGQFDVKICQLEHELKTNIDSNLFFPTADPSAIDLSKLWICFFYEVLRAYKVFKKLKTTDCWFSEVFKELEILRMPMAKLLVKGVGENYQKGYHAELPIFFPTIPSVGWIVYSKDGIKHDISRKSLVNKFLTEGKKKFKQP